MVFGSLSGRCWHAVFCLDGTAGIIVLIGALSGYTIAARLMGYTYAVSAFAFFGAIALVGGRFLARLAVHGARRIIVSVWLVLHFWVQSLSPKAGT